MTTSFPGIKVEVHPVAPSVDEATDFVQEHISSDTPLIIHTGTNNVKKESARIVKQRFDRLETNILAQGIKQVALSSIIYRVDETTSVKIKKINSELKDMCHRNSWLYIDNDNIDSDCL